VGALTASLGNLVTGVEYEAIVVGTCADGTKTPPSQAVRFVTRRRRQGRPLQPVRPFTCAWSYHANTTDNTMQYTAVIWVYELGLFVAGADYCKESQGACDALVMTSPDGETWTRHPTPDGMYLDRLAWSPELQRLIAVASMGPESTKKVSTSTDGKTWASVTHVDLDNGSFDGPSDVVWASEKSLFVAVGEGDTIGYSMTSADGITWSDPATCPLPDSASPYSLAWSPELGIFAAVGEADGDSFAWTSPDGCAWTARDTNVNTINEKEWGSIAWSPELSLFVAVSKDSDEAYTGLSMSSPDGITWTQHDTADEEASTNNGYRSVVWAREFGVFVAVGSNDQTGKTIYSSDGVTWSSCDVSAFPEGGADWSTLGYSPDLVKFTALGARAEGYRGMSNP
jgi:hypothetical protein